MTAAVSTQTPRAASWSGAARGANAPRERGILFSAPMVRALLAGTKTQTRRLDAKMRVTCPYGAVGDRLWVRESWLPLDADHFTDPTKPRDALTDYGPKVPVRRNGAAYMADERDGDGKRARLDYGYKWRPSIFMPRWASRITLEVTEVRVQRLQDISEEDAREEGLTCKSKDGGRTWKWGVPDRDGWPGTDNDGWPWHEWETTAKAAYAKLWA